MTSADLRLEAIGQAIQAMHHRRHVQGICLPSDQEQLEALILDAAKLSKSKSAKAKTAAPIAKTK